MADAFYTAFFQRLGNKEIDLDTDVLTLVLIDVADYTFSAGHDDFADVAAAARVATVNLGSVTLTNGVLDAADPTFTAVSGDPCEALVLYDNTHASDALICYIDSYNGFPVTPSGGNIPVIFPSSGIISLP